VASASQRLPLDTKTENVTLGIGRAGVALTLGYLTLAGIDHRDSARQFIADGAKSVASVVMGPALYTGFTGIAWTLGRLAEWEIVRADGATFATLDGALARFIDRDSWPWHIDVVSGLVGFLVYALSRLPSPDAERAVAACVRLLDSRAIELPDGVSWLIAPSLLNDLTRKKAPNGCYNHGVAHGTAGVIAVLSEVVRSGIEEERARRLLEGAVSWLLASRLNDSWNFPTMTGPDVQTKAARVTWCYGAPGIAAVLFRAAETLGRDAWRDVAMQIALWAAERELHESGVNDADFCHGS